MPGIPEGRTGIALLKCVSRATSGRRPDTQIVSHYTSHTEASLCQLSIEGLPEAIRNPAKKSIPPLRKEEREAASWQGRNAPGKKHNPTPSRRVEGKEKELTKN